MNSRNDSCKDGRDSWLVNLMFGKIEDLVVVAKSRRQAEEELLCLEIVFSCVGRLRRGVGQQQDVPFGETPNI